MTRHSYQEEIRRSLDGKDTPKETLKDSTQTPKNTPSKSSQQQCVSKAQRQQTKQNSGAGKWKMDRCDIKKEVLKIQFRSCKIYLYMGF